MAKIGNKCITTSENVQPQCQKLMFSRLQESCLQTQSDTNLNEKKSAVTNYKNH